MKHTTFKSNELLQFRALKYDPDMSPIRGIIKAKVKKCMWENKYDEVCYIEVMRWPSKSTQEVTYFTEIHRSTRSFDKDFMVGDASYKIKFE
jgi:hypothetical protein